MFKLDNKKKTAMSPETSEISLKLENYDDIFSDFDIRPYPRRSFSVDFLDEIRRAARDKDDSGIELLLHLPEKLRNKTDEEVIIERFLAHFKKHHHLLLKEKKRVKRLGRIMVFIGIICMLVAAFIKFQDPSKDFLMSFLLVLLEPAAWFLVWEGMNQIVFHSKNIDPELDFNQKMSHANGHIYFKSY